jgi:Zn-dependent protease
MKGECGMLLVLFFVLLFCQMLFVHEIGHILAVVLTRAGKIKGIGFDRKGPHILWQPFENCGAGKMMAVSAGGPALNLIVAVAVFYFLPCESDFVMLVVYTNLMTAVVNLVYPGSDGYQIYGLLKHGRA